MFPTATVCHVNNLAIFKNANWWQLITGNWSVDDCMILPSENFGFDIEVRAKFAAQMEG